MIAERVDMALFALGSGDVLGGIADPGGGDTGPLPDQERLPKRVRPSVLPHWFSAACGEPMRPAGH
jgi:hypothetical protein